MVCPQDAIMALEESPTGQLRCYRSKFRWGRFLDDIFEAESAVAGESLAFASATQVLSVGSFGVDMALCYCTGAACFVAGLEEQGCEISGDMGLLLLQKK